MSERFLAILGICMGVAIAGMFFSEVNTAMAAIKLEFHATVAELQWIMNLFGIAMVSTVVIAGRLADRYGRKKIYQIGVIMMTVAFLGAGFANRLGVLYIFQTMMGFASAILVPVSQALLSNCYPEEKRSQAIGVWAAILGISLAIGPMVSGFIVEFISWRWVYLIDVPFGMISIWLIAKFATESRKEGDTEVIDWIGSGLLMLCIGSLILAIVQGGIWSMTIVMSCYIVSVISLIVLLYIETKVKAPILHAELFRSKQFLFATAANACIIFYAWASFFLIPLYLQTIHHYSPANAGLIMLFVSVPLAILSVVIGNLFVKTGPKPLIAIGFVLLTISTIIQMTFDSHSSLLMICFGALCYGVGWGFAWGPTTTTAVSTLSVNEAGIASGTFVTFQEIGGNLGLAITVAVARIEPQLESGYRHGMMVLLIVCILGFVANLFIKNIMPKVDTA